MAERVSLCLAHTSSLSRSAETEWNKRLNKGFGASKAAANDSPTSINAFPDSFFNHIGHASATAEIEIVPNTAVQLVAWSKTVFCLPIGLEVAMLKCMHDGSNLSKYASLKNGKKAHCLKWRYM